MQSSMQIPMPGPMGDTGNKAMQSFMPMPMPEPIGGKESVSMQVFMAMPMPEPMGRTGSTGIESPMPMPMPEPMGDTASQGMQSFMTMQMPEPQYATTLLENPAAKLVLGKAKPPVDMKGLASSDVEREVSMSVHWSDEKKLSADEAIVGDETAVHIEGE